MSPADDHHADAERLVKERLVLFTDAVFAIVITLLAIEIKLPEHAPPGGWSNAALAHALAELQPRLMAYAVSFMAVAVIWMAHLRKFSFVRAVDARVIWLNLLQLLCIGLLPFCTAMLAASGQALAATLYAGNLAAAGLFSVLAWRRIVASPALAAPTLTPAVAREGLWRTLVTVAIFLLSMPLAWWQPTVAMLSWLAMIPANMLARRSA